MTIKNGDRVRFTTKDFHGVTGELTRLRASKTWHDGVQYFNVRPDHRLPASGFKRLSASSLEVEVLS